MVAETARPEVARHAMRRWFVPLVLVAVVAQVLISLEWLPHTAFVHDLDLPLTLTGVATGVACWWAYRRSSGTTRTVWALMALVIALDTVANMWWAVLDLTGSSPYVSPADAVYLSTYPPLFAAVFLLARGRAGGRGVRALVDGLVLAMGLGLLAWETLLVAPGSLESARGFVQHLVLVSYPLLDLFLVGGLLGVLLTATRRGASIRLLAGYIALFVAADYTYVVAASGQEVLLEWSNALYVVAYASLGLSALSKDALTVADPTGEQFSRDGLSIALLVAAMVAPALTASVAGALGVDVSAAVLVGTTVVLAVLVGARVAEALRDERKALRVSDEARQELGFLARHDPLTGLPNRYELLDRLARRTGPVGLLFVDLDRFKQVNDTAGHAFGDDVLVEAARRLRDQMRPEDVPHRLGGDEFVVVAADLVDEAAAEALAARLVAALSEPFRSAGVEWYLGASVGIAMAGPSGDDAPDPEHLLRRADMAMFEAKRDPLRNVRLFGADMQRELEHRHGMEVSIRRGLEADEFHPAFQPIVHLADGRVAGFEALARWRTADGTVLPAGAFVPVAEQSGLLGEIDDRVRRQAFELLARRNRGAGPDEAVYLTFNVSATELAAPEVVDRLAALADEAGVELGWLVVELTEGALVRAPEVAADRLAEMRRRGMRIALDDFGTGFSSLSHLLRFPVDVLKIDQTFVAELDPARQTRSVAAATCQLASSLGIGVVAEGVETPAQAASLAALGVDLVQGFLFAAPLAPDDALGCRRCEPDGAVAVGPSTGSAATLDD
ncbi:MAG: putative bifunctional diguanylate cyclase/phosphodiesterase [Actinomycetes bacterium]